MYINEYGNQHVLLTHSCIYYTLTSTHTLRAKKIRKYFSHTHTHTHTHIPVVT